MDDRRALAKKRVIALLIAAAAVGGAFWYVFSKPAALQQITTIGNSAEQFAVKSITQNISAPPPLKKTFPIPSGSNSTLTRTGVIADTNAQRKANGGLVALSENATLDEIATLRLDDMFAKQYFAHVAPDGSSAQTVAATVGYQYLAIGENLAQGNFAGDHGVVDAWMGSPGHRANILNTHYTEIGVAVRQGMFQGENTWLAVQVFGRPAADCPAPSVSLKATITASEAQLAQMNTDLANKKAAIDASNPKYGPDYDAKVSDYNAEVAQYNSLAAQTKTQVNQYNAEVQAYNACINA